MKKVLSLILALLMIVSCASFIFADDAVTAAAPADETASAYYDAVQFLVKYNIMHGKGDSLGVYDNIKRYEMALFIGRISTGWVEDDQWEDGPENASNFTDLAGTAAESFYGAISYCNEKGIIEGVGGGKFAPEAGIKYEDALTMAVRALGYQGLAYPWGYIEKAVSLGLTDGIKGVAYTETLKREVVAQIIYNALFAANAEGTTLAKANFDLDLNYEVVMITASDMAAAFAGGETSAPGYVKYQVVNADGTLGQQVYTAPAESFGLSGEHDDEIALGTSYKVIFNKNTEYGIGQILSVEALELEPVVNAGLNSKSAGKYPIQALLGDVVLVSSYGKNEYNKNDSQFIFYTMADEATIVLTDLVAVDWENGNILVKDDKGVYQIAWFYNQLLDTYFRYKKTVKDNGDITLAGIEFMSEAKAKEIYGNVGLTRTLKANNVYAPVTDSKKIATTAYAELRVFDLNGDGTADYGIYEAYRLGRVDTSAPILDISALVVGDTVADTQGYFPGRPDLWYTRFAKASLKYVNEGFNIFDYSLVPNGGAKFGTIPFKSTTTVNYPGCKPGWVAFQNGGATDEGDIVNLGITLDDAWIADGTEIGTGDWVIFGANVATNELTIVEKLGAYEEGKETYVATGILRAYSTNKKTVTIGTEVFSTSYDELKGSTFTSEFYKDGVWYKGSQYLKDLFNQFVTYVVVDGKVVYVEACGAESQRFLVVDGMAGISKDGYLVIDAWDTADGAHKQIRIDSCDGWEYGDFFYYADNYNNYSDLFVPYTFLQILSYNPETNAYGVKKIINLEDVPNQAGFTYSGDKSSVSMSGEQRINANGLDLIWFMFDYRFAKANIQLYIYQGKYRPAPTAWGDGDTAWTAAGGGSIPGSTNGLAANMSEEKFIMIFQPGEIAGSPIRIWEGKVTNSDWSIQGFRLVGTDSKTHIYVGLRAGDVKGFGIGESSASHTLVMIPDYKKLDDLGSWYRPDLGHTSGWQIQWGSSDDYFTNADQHPWGYTIDATYGQDDEVLLGNTQYSVVVLNLRTLHTETVHVSNKNMLPNYIYECIDGQVVGQPHDAGELCELLIGTFGNNACDLENDLTELYTTYYNTADKYSAQEPGSTNENWIHAGYTVLGTNQWMSEKWLGTAYADFGSYLINREWANAAVIAVYEGKDGHVEITPLGMGGGKNRSTPYNITKNGAYGEYPVHGDKSYGDGYDEGEQTQNTVDYFLTGTRHVAGGVNVVAVTVVNMDNVKLQRNLSPYGNGLALVTWLFDTKIVGEINHKFDK